jgi:SAM-dependent methyltransferase
MALPAWTSGAHVCANCGTAFELRDGIYRFLLPERLTELQPFLDQYRAVREKDGYRSHSPDYYRSLPTVEPDHPQAETWYIRQVTFNHLCCFINGRHRLQADGYAEPNPRSGFPPNARRRFLTDAATDAEPLSILDLGAGNGWLSHQLTALGHQCAAVDWLDDAEDGLGASRHYPVEFLCAQADFDRLPFAPGQFDLVIFNASLHYAPNVSATLERAALMLAPGGALVIMDSPLFQSASAGRQMVAEMEDNFKKRYGLSEVIRSGVGYLLLSDLVEMGRKLEMEFQFLPSRVGWLWETRRLLAGLKNGRESARFGLALYCGPSAQSMLRLKVPLGFFSFFLFLSFFFSALSAISAVKINL